MAVPGYSVTQLEECLLAGIIYHTYMLSVSILSTYETYCANEAAVNRCWVARLATDSLSGSILGFISRNLEAKPRAARV